MTDYKCIQNENGSMITGLTFTFALISMVGFSSGLISNNKSMQQSIKYRSVFKKIEDRVRGLVLNEVAWEHTLNAAVNSEQMRCLRDVDTAPASCFADGNTIAGSITIFEGRTSGGAAVPFYSAKDSSSFQGFSVFGERCDSFYDPTSSETERPDFDESPGETSSSIGHAVSKDCPIRLNLTLVTRCQAVDGPCDINSVDIVGEFDVLSDSALFSNLNSGAYSFVVNRGALAKLNKTTCQQMGSEFEDLGGSEVCRMPLPDYNCPAGEGIHRVLADGTVECATL